MAGAVFDRIRADGYLTRTQVLNEIRPGPDDHGFRMRDGANNDNFAEFDVRAGKVGPIKYTQRGTLQLPHQSTPPENPKKGTSPTLTGKTWDPGSREEYYAFDRTEWESMT